MEYERQRQGMTHRGYKIVISILFCRPEIGGVYPFEGWRVPYHIYPLGRYVTILKGLDEEAY